LKLLSLPSSNNGGARSRDGEATEASGGWDAVMGSGKDDERTRDLSPTDDNFRMTTRPVTGRIAGLEHYEDVAP
jgi:hypothetical protein